MSAGNGARWKASKAGRIEAALRLRERKRELAAELAGESSKGDELAEGWQDRDSPSEDETRDVEYSHRDALRRELLAVVEALARVRSNKYGECTRCSGMIEAKRLACNPAVALCFSCQTEVEGHPHFPTL
jgi:RNA polymerase-binding transcription factor DksA